MKHVVVLEDVAMVARRLAALDTRFVFTGGSVVTLLLDQPRLALARPTKDVDVIAEVATRIQYTALEERLRAIGFRHDTSEGAPICRWIAEDVRVDVMPMSDPTGTMENRWFTTAVATAATLRILDVTIHAITAPCFVATKIEAFLARAPGRFMDSHDLEDLLTVVDGRESLVSEIQGAPATLSAFIAHSMASFLADPRFLESLPGHLPPDSASQRRLPRLLQKLNELATPAL